MQLPHVPVLCEEVIQALGVRPGGSYVDCTVGNGGHAQAILEHSQPAGRLLGIDADPHSLAIARGALAAYGERVILVQSNYSAVGEIARQRGFQTVQGVLMDLGWSSSQMGDPSRGFSFQVDGPLDMRYDPQQPVTAANLVNELSEKELAGLIWRYGEDRRSRQIARAIVAQRPLRTTGELARLIERTVGRREKIHPATRVFQALRIAVNVELDSLDRTLEQLPGLLAPAGVLAIITFHSLEDRMVKQFMQREAAGCICPPEMVVCTCGHQATLVLQFKKPITPSPAEVQANPRARSAKLRVAMRKSS